MWFTERLYNRLIANEPNWAEKQHIMAEASFERGCVFENWSEWQGEKLRTKARRMFIPTPRITGKDEDPNWIQSQQSGKYYMSVEAIDALRRRIREEEDAKRKTWQFRAAMTFGALGSIAGVGTLANWVMKIVH
jgi:hypothetical protein